MYRGAPLTYPAKKRRKRFEFNPIWNWLSQAIKNLIGPESLQAMQRLVQGCELFGVDAAELFDGSHVFLIEALDGGAPLAALVGQLDAHRAPVDPRSLVIEKSHLDKFLKIIRDIGAEIIAARAQLSGG